MTPFVAFLLVCGTMAEASSPPENAVWGTQRDYGKSGTVGDPISAASGAFSWSKTLFDLGGPMDLHFTLTYRSDPPYNRERNPGDFPPDYSSWESLVTWSWSPAPFATDAGVNQFRVETDDGSLVCFVTNASGQFVYVTSDNFGRKQSVSENFQLEKQGDWLYFCDPDRGRVTMLQNHAGTLYRPVYVMDRNSNSLTYSYVGDSDDNPTDIHDGEGRSLHIADVGYWEGWNYKYCFVQVVDQNARSWSFLYDTNAPDNNGRLTLRGIVGPDDRTNLFAYTPNNFSGSMGDNTTNISLLAQVIEPLGNSTFSNEYIHTSIEPGAPANVRVYAQSDAYGNRTTLNMSYSGGKFLGTVTNADGTTERFTHGYHHDEPPAAIRDEAGRTMNFSINSNALYTSVTDRLNGVTCFGYDASGRRLETLTNAAGHVLRFTYETVEQTFHNPATNQSVTFEFDQLVRIDYPDTAFDMFAYDGRGNVTMRTDRAGAIWITAYDERGRVLSTENPLGGLTTYSYATNGLLQSVTNSDGFCESYGYDAYFRLTAVTNADGTARRFSYDAMDRVTTLVNELNQTNRFAYDANGRLVSASDPCGQGVLCQYDLMNRLTGVVDRTGGLFSRSFDARGRAVALESPDGIVSRLAYSIGDLQSTFSIGESTWSNRYDAEGLLAETLNPSGASWIFTRDALGNLTNTTDVLGRSSTITHDAMQRPTDFTDPLSRATHRAYTPIGNWSSVMRPDGSAISNTWNEAGHLTAFRDLNGQTWQFERSPLGRLDAMTDPLGRQTGWNYDARGNRNLQVRTAPGMAFTNRFHYDAAGRLTNIVYHDATAIAFERDACGRIVAAPGVILQRDAAGRVTNTLRHGRAAACSYDASGRLVSIAYASGAFRVLYTYNRTNGLLERVTDTLSSASVAFEYDADFRLVRMTRGNGTTATQLFDAAGRLAHLADNPLLDQRLAYDAAGQVTQMVAILPLNPPSRPSQTNSWAFDAAAQVASPSYAFDTLRRLTNSPAGPIAWRGDDTVRQIGAATFEFDGLGHLLARIEEGRTSRYHFAHATGPALLLTEESADTSADLRHYVWTPAGTLLYMLDATAANAPRYYHFDLSGHALALTDAAGQIADAYAYDPYGRLVAHEGDSPQPFTFSGRWGVRRDGSNDLYQMGVRWYDANTARFLTPEPLWPNLEIPAALNPYQYAYQNPLQRADPDGLAPSTVGTTPNDEALLRQYNRLTEEYRASVNTYSTEKQFLDNAEKLNRHADHLMAQEPEQAEEMDEFSKELMENAPLVQQQNQLRLETERQNLMQHRQAMLAFVAGNRAALQKALPRQRWNKDEKHGGMEQKAWNQFKNALMDFSGPGNQWDGLLDMERLLKDDAERETFINNSRQGMMLLF